MAVKASDHEAAQEKGVRTVFLPGFFTSSGEEPASRERAGHWTPTILIISLGFALAAGGWTGWCQGPAAGWGGVPAVSQLPPDHAPARTAVLAVRVHRAPSVCRQRSGSKWGGYPPSKGGGGGGHGLPAARDFPCVSTAHA